MAANFPLSSAPTLFDSVSYGSRFLTDYAGPIVTEPRTAIAELIANAHDAGATLVEVTWPPTTGEAFSVSDNGSGMTKDEFLHRWTCLAYDRIKEQGEFAEFPPTVLNSNKRPVFGRNGKGRHAAFCFADEYTVETTKAGATTYATVRLSTVEASPFVITMTEGANGLEHGTKVSWNADRRGITEDSLSKLITSVFMLDPHFSIRLNGNELDLANLEGLQKDTLSIPPYGSVNVYIIDTKDAKRHNRPGVAWRVRSRLVGEPGWKEMETDGRWQNGKPDAAKRFCFLVDADILKSHVKPRFEGFHDAPITAAVRKAVGDHVVRAIKLFANESVVKKKRAALSANSEILRSLPRLSVQTVTTFIEEVQVACPRLSQKDLDAMLRVLALLEQSRAGYNMLGQLAQLDPDDLDRWSAIMTTWAASDAEAVLDEIERRLNLISRIETLMADRKTDEVHDLLPLFGQGLWLFGPMYESVEYRANRSLATMIRQVLGGKSPVAMPSARPDVVATPSGYVLPFSLNGFDHATGEVSDLSSVLLIELKKGAFKITLEDCNQALRYIEHLRGAGHAGPKTAFTAYVLGWQLGDYVSDQTFGQFEPKSNIYPRTYEHVVKMAKSRMMGLAEKLRSGDELPALDPDVAAVLKPTVDVPLLSPSI